MKRGEHFLVNEVLCVLGQEMQASMKTAAGTTKSRQKLGCVSSRLIGKVICCPILKLHSSVECKILMLFKDKKKHGTHFFFIMRVIQLPYLKTAMNEGQGRQQIQKTSWMAFLPAKRLSRCLSKIRQCQWKRMKEVILYKPQGVSDELSVTLHPMSTITILRNALEGQLEVSLSQDAICYLPGTIWFTSSKAGASFKVS